PEATRSRIAKIIAGKPVNHWHSVFLEADCCCTIVQSIEQAMEDPDFRARGLFNRSIGNDRGQTITALPLPIAPAFRDASPDRAMAPRLGEHNASILKPA
ncbi:MAG: CoA transferase, partial [Geminicoccaceae bacterium]